MATKKAILKVPEVGDTIYVPTSLYLGHGRDDFMGGKATVSGVSIGISGGENVHFIEVAESNSGGYNWEQYLAKDQKNLKKQFGDQKAHADPDMDPQFNRDD